MATLIADGDFQIDPNLEGSTLTITDTALGGAAPWLVLFRFVHANTKASFYAGAMMAVGETDGSLDGSIAAVLEDSDTLGGLCGATFGTPSPLASNLGMAIRGCSPQGVYQSTGTAMYTTALIANGFQVFFERADTIDGDWFVHYTMFAGDGSASLEKYSIAGAASTTFDKTGLGTTPDLVMIHGIEASSIPTTGSTRHDIVEGRWGAVDGVSHCIATAWESSGSPSQCVQRIANDCVLMEIDTDSPNGDLGGRVTLSPLANGYRLTLDEAHSSGWQYIGVAIEFGGTKLAEVGLRQTPTATGSQAVNDFSISPDWIELLFTRKTSINGDPPNGADASVFGAGYGKPGSGSPGNSYVNTSEHNVTGSNTNSLSDDRLIALPIPVGSFGTGAVRASLTTKLPRGFGLQVTQADATQGYWYLATLVGDSQVLTPDPVVVPLAVPSVTNVRAQVPAPVVVPVLSLAPTVLGATVQTPDPVVVTLVVPVPFTGFILPDPVVVTLFAPEPFVIAPRPPAVPIDLQAVNRDSLFDLLPRGIVWPRELDSTLGKLLLGLAKEPATIEERVALLRDEADTRTGVELLEAWEEWLDIAGDCDGVVETALQLRRAAVTAKLTSPGGQNAFHFSQLAKSLGYEVEIGDFEQGQLFRVGISGAGDPVPDDEYVYCVTVHAPIETPRFFRTGSSSTGEPIVGFGNDLLECVLELAKPAHLFFKFSYDKLYVGYAPWTQIHPAPVVVQLFAPSPLVT